MKQITEMQKQALEIELEELNRELDELAIELAQGMQKGDFSENADVDASRQKIDNCTSRKIEIENLLQTAEIIKTVEGNRISLGCLITVRDITNSGKERLLKFEGVGDPIVSGILSADSPLGKKINGNPSGTYTIQTDIGESISYQVNRVSTDRLKEHNDLYPVASKFFEREFTLKDE